MKFSTETLMAYADGELDATTRAQIESAMQSDAALADAVAAQIEHREALQAKLRAAFNSALQEDVPAHLIDVAEGPVAVPASNVTPLSNHRLQPRETAGARRPWMQWGALAATLVLGVFIGRVTMTGDATPFVADHGRMLARGRLDTALTEQAGGIRNIETGIQIGVSYLAKNGDYCRTFTLKDAQAIAGLACRRNESWTIDALTRTRADASGAYRMAGAAVPPLILGLVEDTIAGDPLDAEQEREARERRWQR